MAAKGGGTAVGTTTPLDGDLKVDGLDRPPTRLDPGVG